MTVSTLKRVLDDRGLSQTEAAREAGVSIATINLLVNKGQAPKNREMQKRLSTWFGLDITAVKPVSSPDEEVNQMLSLTTLRHFKMFVDPFVNDIVDDKDVYKTAAFLDIENSMRWSARASGILCIVGESGSGKTVARDLVTANFLEKDRVNVIYPRSFEKDKLNAAAICQSIIEDLGGGGMKRGMEARARQVEKLLLEQVQAGFTNVLFIEEAHDLHRSTLKFLKRFWEMKCGFKRLIGIILIGQPELKNRLKESSNWDAREFIRRATTVELAPYSVADIRAYLALKFKRMNIDPASIFAEDAFPAIERRLVVDASGRLISNAYPLLINNLVRRALNEAASLCLPRVNADLINNL